MHAPDLRSRRGKIGCLKLVVFAIFAAIVIAIFGPRDDRGPGSPQLPQASVSDNELSSPLPSPSTTAQSAGDSGSGSSQSARDAEFRKQIEAFGIPVERRKEIFRKGLAADDRAIWEANRLYPPTQYLENINYHKSAIKKYHRNLEELYRITAEQRKLIFQEGVLAGWTIPEYPSFDIMGAARRLALIVYANQGELTYHRPNCTRLDRDRPIVNLALERALATKGAVACQVCMP